MSRHLGIRVSRLLCFPGTWVVSLRSATWLRPGAKLVTWEDINTSEMQVRIRRKLLHYNLLVVIGYNGPWAMEISCSFTYLDLIWDTGVPENERQQA